MTITRSTSARPTRRTRAASPSINHPRRASRRSRRGTSPSSATARTWSGWRGPDRPQGVRQRDDAADALRSVMFSHERASPASTPCATAASPSPRSPTRVGVVWTTAATLIRDDAAGSYMISRARSKPCEDRARHHRALARQRGEQCGDQGERRAVFVPGVIAGEKGNDGRSNSKSRPPASLSACSASRPTAPHRGLRSRRALRRVRLDASCTFRAGLRPRRDGGRSPSAWT